MSISFRPVTRENCEEALKLQVSPEQMKFAPSVAESLASAYIKPWDEALDPFVICVDDQLVGLFYISYTPDSKDNYWIGGFIIDRKFQGRGYGRRALREMLSFVPTVHPNCQEIKLTVEKENLTAQKLYRSLGFDSEGETNKYGEIIYTFPVEP
jgi:diamine N-acetyltransferase